MSAVRLPDEEIATAGPRAVLAGAPAEAAAPAAPQFDCGRDYSYNNGSLGVEVVTIGILDSGGVYGHLQFFGPHGTIGNSADSSADSADIRINPSQSTKDGDLWCDRFWRRNSNGTYTQIGPDTCVTV
ncbi:hypothetical protein [Amycolatopsis sp. GM8]|uniref:hypothetical protein n=1 Tax=Amycolatopsis sp. GM8 TaxID=2896530 RepID=UPI001F30B046|nr:hypothetical protein [Amycolatopsis sp. GM8]